MNHFKGYRRLSDNAEKMDIPDQLPEKRNKRVSRLSEEAKDEGIDIAPQQSLAMNV